MRAQMMDMPLLVSSIIAHADRSHGDTEIVSRTVEGPIHRYTYSEAHRRSKRLAQALARLGVREGERVGTLAWNGFRHFELYYGVAGMGTVIHTVNPRLFPEQLVFIVNAWGIPYAAPLNGAKLVFPGAGLDGKSLYELFETEKVTNSAGVPTVWLALLAHMKQNNLRFSTLKTVTVGGSACPPAMIDTFRDDYGVHRKHAWGMTEMRPLGSFCTLKAKHEALPREKRREVELKQGRTIYGVEMKIVEG